MNISRFRISMGPQGPCGWGDHLFGQPPIIWTTPPHAHGRLAVSVTNLYVNNVGRPAVNRVATDFFTSSFHRITPITPNEAQFVVFRGLYHSTLFARPGLCCLSNQVSISRWPPFFLTAFLPLTKSRLTMRLFPRTTMTLSGSLLTSLRLRIPLPSPQPRLTMPKTKTRAVTAQHPLDHLTGQRWPDFDTLLKDINNKAEALGFGLVKRRSTRRDPITGLPRRYDLVCVRGRPPATTSTGQRQNTRSRRGDCPFAARAVHLQREQQLVLYD